MSPRAWKRYAITQRARKQAGMLQQMPTRVLSSRSALLPVRALALRTNFRCLWPIRIPVVPAPGTVQFRDGDFHAAIIPLRTGRVTRFLFNFFPKGDGRKSRLTRTHQRTTQSNQTRNAPILRAIRQAAGFAVDRTRQTLLEQTNRHTPSPWAGERDRGVAHRRLRDGLLFGTTGKPLPSRAPRRRESRRPVLCAYRICPDHG